MADTHMISESAKASKPRLERNFYQADYPMFAPQFKY